MQWEMCLKTLASVLSDDKSLCLYCKLRLDCTNGLERGIHPHAYTERVHNWSIYLWLACFHLCNRHFGSIMAVIWKEKNSCTTVCSINHTKDAKCLLGQQRSYLRSKPNHIYPRCVCKTKHWKRTHFLLNTYNVLLSTQLFTEWSVRCRSISSKTVIPGWTIYFYDIVDFYILTHLLRL